VSVGYAHWGLKEDPFHDVGSPYVPLPGHAEALARLLHTIDAGQPLAILSGPSGSGKTRLLLRALAEARMPNRRLALARGPVDPGNLCELLAERLGARRLSGAEPASAFRALVRAVQVCRLQNLQVVLAVDDTHSLLAADAGEGGLRRLVQLAADTDGRATVLLVAGEEALDKAVSLREWTLAIRVKPLLRREVEEYVVAKLAAAGCHDRIFTPMAITRLHSRSGGLLRGIDRLASLCLLAGASRGQETITAELVESVLRECHPPPELQVVEDPSTADRLIPRELRASS
jgi:type II secretory pathway predicted ATPase ExeA